MEVTEVYKEFAQYGLLGLVLLFLGIGLGYTLRWLGVNVVKPWVAKNMEYTDEAIKTMKQFRTDSEALTAVYVDLKKSVDSIRAHQRCPDSINSTIHTNNAIRIIAECLKGIAQHSSTDLHDLCIRLERTLDEQDRPGK